MPFSFRSQFKRTESGQISFVTPTQRIAESVSSSAVKGNRIESADSKPLLLHYQSGVKRAILVALIKNPHAADVEICRSLDADGGEELPSGWRNGPEDRFFFNAFRIFAGATHQPARTSIRMDRFGALRSPTGSPSILRTCSTRTQKSISNASTRSTRTPG